MLKLKNFIPALMFIILLIPLYIYAEQVFVPLEHATMTPVGGSDATGEAQVLRVNNDGSLNIAIVPGVGATITNALVDIPDAGAADRTQMPALAITSCTFQADTVNAGSIYGGGITVTNASGANKGVELAPGMPWNNVSISNLNLVYFSTDTAGDNVIYVCN